MIIYRDRLKLMRIDKHYKKSCQICYKNAYKNKGSLNEMQRYSRASFVFRNSQHDVYRIF